MYFWIVRLMIRISSFSSSPWLRSAPHGRFCSSEWRPHLESWGSAMTNWKDVEFLRGDPRRVLAGA